LLSEEADILKKQPIRVPNRDVVRSYSFVSKAAGQVSAYGLSPGAKSEFSRKYVKYLRASDLADFQNKWADWKIKRISEKMRREAGGRVDEYFLKQDISALEAGKAARAEAIRALEEEVRTAFSPFHVGAKNQLFGLLHKRAEKTGKAFAAVYFASFASSVSSFAVLFIALGVQSGVGAYLAAVALVHLAVVCAITIAAKIHGIASKVATRLEKFLPQ
jgi:small basic protein